MDLDLIAPMVVSVVMILTVGGVVLLRPLSKRLGDLLEAMQKDRQDPALAQSLNHLADVLEATNRRLEELEERQAFSEELLRSRNTPQALPGPETDRPAGE